MGNPVLTHINTYGGTLAAAAVNGDVTFSFCMTAGFEAWLPISVATSMAISAVGEVVTYRSTDGGASWPTSGSTREILGSIAAGAAVAITKVVRIPKPGMYLVRVHAMDGTASTQTFTLGTQEILTAIA